MCRNHRPWALLAGLAATCVMSFGVSQAAQAQTDIGPKPSHGQESPAQTDVTRVQVHRGSSADTVVPVTAATDADEIRWNYALKNLHERNRLAGTVMIGGERWTPERQAAEPDAFRSALADAQSRVASPEYQAARKAELDRIYEGTKAYRERRLEEVALDRQERRAKLEFDWQTEAGWRLAANAVRVKIHELDATATANALALQSTKVNVVQSPGMTLHPTSSVNVTPEMKERVLRRFLNSDESMNKIAMDNRVPPQLVRQWVREVLK